MFILSLFYLGFCSSEVLEATIVIDKQVGSSEQGIKVAELLLYTFWTL